VQKKFLYHQQKIEYDIYIKGCVRSITKYYILQHELTTAMQCQLKAFRKILIKYIVTCFLIHW